MGRPSWNLESSGTVRSALCATRKRVPRSLVLLQHLVDRRLVLKGALQRLLGGLVVEVVDLLVALGLPVDEDAHQDTEIVGLALVDHTRRDAVHDRASDGGL